MIVLDGKNNANESAILVKGVRVLKKFPDYELLADRKRAKITITFENQNDQLFFCRGRRTQNVI